jgi:hypothetical protein
MNIRKLIRETLESNLTVVYRGGYIKASAPVFWSTDINVAMAFYNEVRYVANIGSKTKSLSLEDVRDIQISIELYEEPEWVLGWDIIATLDKPLPEGLKRSLKDIFGNIPKTLTITENPDTALLEGIPVYKNPMILDFKGKIWGQSGAVIEHYFPEAKQNGNDVIIVNNIIEGGIGRPIGDTPGTTYVDMTGKSVKNLSHVNSYPDISHLV